MHDLTDILTRFEKIVSPISANALARRCRFIQRSTSQIEGYEFAQAMMVPNAFLEAESLNSLAVRMKNLNKSCNISASALAQRINTKTAENFMRACFGKVLKEVVKQDFAVVSDLPNLSGFNRVLIEDSTRAELHEKLSPYFKGSGGIASKASLKIDYIFDYLSEEIVDIDFFSGNTPDQKLSSRIISMLEKDDLVIRDLGYFVLKSIQDIEKAEAYYVSRWKVSEIIYDSKDAVKPVDLEKFIQKHMYKGLADIQVFVGKNKHPVRLIACLMDEEAINKRLRDANTVSKRRGAQISKKKKALLRFSIYITNVPESILSSTSVMAVYRARWRVELIFKQWKSCLHLHVFKGYNKERFYCFLYGRLIMCLLLGKIYPILMRYAFGLSCELSNYKLIQYLIADHAFPQALQEGRIEKFIAQLLADIPRRLCKDKRKRPTLRNNVREGNSYYNLNVNNLCNLIA